MKYITFLEKERKKMFPKITQLHETAKAHDEI